MRFRWLELVYWELEVSGQLGDLVQVNWVSLMVSEFCTYDTWHGTAAQHVSATWWVIVIHPMAGSRHGPKPRSGECFCWAVEVERTRRGNAKDGGMEAWTNLEGLALPLRRPAAEQAPESVNARDEAGIHRAERARALLDRCSARCQPTAKPQRRGAVGRQGLSLFLWLKIRRRAGPGCVGGSRAPAEKEGCACCAWPRRQGLSCSWPWCWLGVGHAGQLCGPLALKKEKTVFKRLSIFYIGIQLRNIILNYIIYLYMVYVWYINWFKWKAFKNLVLSTFRQNELKKLNFSIYLLSINTKKSEKKQCTSLCRACEKT